MSNPFADLTAAQWRYEHSDAEQSQDCHCPDCGGWFSGADRSGGHCRGGKYGGCCKSFRSVSGFDKHRTGPYSQRRCLTTEELLSKGWSRDDANTWRMPAPVHSPWASQTPVGRDGSPGPGSALTPVPGAEPGPSSGAGAA